MPSSAQAFILAVDKAVLVADQRLDDVVRGAASVVGENVMVGGEYAPGTPVDTGFARASWWASINSEGGGPADAQEGGDVPDAAASVAGARAGDVVYWLNNAEYIPELEDGWSPQAPSGMVKLVVMAWQTLVNQVVRRVKGR